MTDAIMAGTTKVRHLIRVTPTTTYTFVSPSILVIPFSNYSRSMLTMTRLCTTRNEIIAKTIITTLKIRLSNVRAILYTLSSFRIGKDESRTYRDFVA
jgi:hypothetical protein